MFRKIRKRKRQLSDEETIEIIKSCDYGVLATTGADNYPYAVPVNYVYHNGKIYFHCALVGHKIDNIEYNANVSLCIVRNCDIIPEEFTTGFKSVILFGKAREVGDVEKEEGLVALVNRFSTEHREAGAQEIRSAWDKTKVIVIEIEYMTGKGKTF